MSVAVLYMSMSPDGYIAGPNDEPSNPGGDGFIPAARVGPHSRRGRPPDGGAGWDN